MVGLWDRRESKVSTYSGGMQRRLEIARGLLHAPHVLFLDEPTVGLDRRTRSSIWRYINELKQREDITIFLTTHYMDEAEHCDRIAIIDQGKIVAVDTPEALKASVGKDRVQISTADDQAAIAELKDGSASTPPSTKGSSPSRWSRARSSCHGVRGSGGPGVRGSGGPGVRGSGGPGDREFGFLREMLVAPVNRGAIVLGKCLGGATVATFQGIIVLGPGRSGRRAVQPAPDHHAHRRAAAAVVHAHGVRRNDGGADQAVPGLHGAHSDAGHAAVLPIRRAVPAERACRPGARC